MADLRCTTLRPGKDLRMEDGRARSARPGVLRRGQASASAGRIRRGAVPLVSTGGAVPIFLPFPGLEARGNAPSYFSSGASRVGSRIRAAPTSKAAARTSPGAERQPAIWDGVVPPPEG